MQHHNYKSIYDILKEDIINGKYPKGTLLPRELDLAADYSVSRPTIAKVYNKLQVEGYLSKKKGSGTTVIYKPAENGLTFGLLLPGAGESEIFSIINDQLLKQSKVDKFNCLWEGATASSAEVRKTLIDNYCDSYISKGVNGIFFSPLERVPDAEKLNHHICEKIRNARIPIVLIDRDIVEFPERSPYDLVSIDNYSAGFIMGKHLIEAGCELIYFFYRPDSAASVKLRLSGVRAAAQENNLPFDHSTIICADPENVQLVKQIKIKPGKTGIICANDSTAAVLMSTLDIVGLKVPSDLLISGYDNMKYAEHLKCSLTSYQQPCKEIANVSIELMYRRIKNANAVPLTVHLDGEIVVRDSSRFS